MSSYFITDTITTDSKTYVGIIDYATTKHVMFYDFSQNNNPDIIMMLIVWKSYFSSLRFSVFKSLYFDHFDIGSPIMINKKTIKSNTGHIPVSKPKRKILGSISIECPQD